MRKLLDELYENIRSCEVEKIKNEKEIEKIKNEIEEVTISLNSSDSLSKLEKMKQQMNLSYLQSKLELSEMEEKNTLNSELATFQEEINLKIKKIEDAIYLSIRLNDLQYVNTLEKMRVDKIKNVYNISEIKNYFNNNTSDQDIKVSLEILPEFNSIYEYYKKISDIENKIINSYKENEMKINRIKNNKFMSEEEKRKRITNISEKYSMEKIKPHINKLYLLEELIDEMAAEVIREDMKKNNITLPKFIKEIRYFKSEDKEI